MKILAAAWCAAVFLGLIIPAAAQSQPPLLGQPNPPVGPFIWDTPSPGDIVKREGAEVPSVTNVAKRLYATLTKDSLDTARLTPELQRAWTPTIEATASAELASRGTPSWSFVGNAATSAGDVSVYRLAYANADPVYMSVGVSDAGVVYDLRLARSARNVAPPPVQ